MHTYLSSSTAKHNHDYGTLSWPWSREHECWESERAESGNPWHSHADWSHPFAIVLPVSNCMDDLEVALQGDDYQTDISSVHTKDRQPFNPGTSFHL